MVGVINRVTQLSKSILEADVMSLVINTNVASLNAQRSLATSGSELKTAMERPNRLRIRKPVEDDPYLRQTRCQFRLVV